jgi:hypothetical protein
MYSSGFPDASRKFAGYVPSGKNTIMISIVDADCLEGTPGLLVT